MENVPIDANISMHIERKLACVQAIPGITELSGLPTPADAEHAQLDLIRAHVQYIAELTNEATLLCSLCALERSSPIYETAQALESYFGGLIHSLSLKLRIIAADMFNELYSAETVQALESLRGLLKTEEARLLKEQAVLDEQLAIYREAGEEFQEIAQSYARIVQETQAVRRDMADLQNL
ncbi:hypothetical protein DL89DRAFT_181053 [Linderina pennispora]|uniref:Uncharacterized protein n=1 Tax=Linderina pennispora TaxID=61395 RepID=A0A1Y1W5L1_9FUNG|nr:uncharacterized protein DL89DRAFT_181053 [Linderina pennispora]ORX68625.1 hypothetical protein DL89DRAFT_181053 [Linderina pennispora]